MADTRTLSSSSSTTTTTNVNNSVPTTSSPSSDADNINGLTTYVNTIFHQMEEKFMAASDQMMNRMNELGKKIDSLETNLGDIISHLPTEESSTQTNSSKQQNKSEK
ncbi:unnamed protein product [Adineta ricciae]|uniref:Uncharacterized protein n=1 Tax=Adineta ricciae TaxID=249248 RepID=A0A815QIJ2_ADIRI|nr:unnamed protein product [Adineta ricciae]CAF1463823.1 unnamed protein product [Adineta ricciae]